MQFEVDEKLPRASCSFTPFTCLFLWFSPCLCWTSSHRNLVLWVRGLSLIFFSYIYDLPFKCYIMCKHWKFRRDDGEGEMKGNLLLEIQVKRKAAKNFIPFFFFFWISSKYYQNSPLTSCYYVIFSNVDLCTLLNNILWYILAHQRLGKFTTLTWEVLFGVSDIKPYIHLQICEVIMSWWCLIYLREHMYIISNNIRK